MFIKLTCTHIDHDIINENKIKQIEVFTVINVITLFLIVFSTGRITASQVLAGSRVIREKRFAPAHS